MYAQHFGLSARPFGAGTGQQFLPPNDGVSKAAAHLQEVLTSDNAAAIISGGPGVGKTSLLEYARTGLGNDAVIAWADMRQAEPEQLFDLLIISLGGEPADGSGPAAARELRRLLKEHNASGRQVTAAIDLTGITAERARRLLRLVNLAGEPGFQLNTVLMGPHTLHKLLDVPGLIHIRQRVTLRYRIRPLSDVETGQYLAERIRAADGDPERVLASGIPKLVYSYVAGVPRLINTLMEAALTEAAARGLDQLDAECVQDVAKLLGWRQMGQGAKPPARPVAVSKPAPQTSSLEAASASAPPAAPAESKPSHAASDLTAALIGADLKIEEAGNDATQAAEAQPPAPPAGVPEMNPDDTSATGMMRLEDLDDKFAETVFGEKSGSFKALADREAS